MQKRKVADVKFDLGKSICENKKKCFFNFKIEKILLIKALLNILLVVELFDVGL